MISMKKTPLCRLIACLLFASLFTACASTRCECENNRKYKQKKGKISLINHQKNTTFALQNEGKREL
jgi:hypothetical protein